MESTPYGEPLGHQGTLDEVGGLSPVGGEPNLEGWLVKRGAKRKNWKVRWFEKRGDKLVYSVAKDKTAKGFIPLREVLSVSAQAEAPVSLVKKSGSFMHLKRERSESKEKEIEAGGSGSEGSGLARRSHKRGGSVAGVHQLAVAVPPVGSDSGEQPSVTITSSASSTSSTCSLDDSDSEEDEGERKKRAQYDKGFQIETEKRIFFLLASSDKERERWVKGIEYHIRQMHEKEIAAQKLKEVEEALRAAQESERAAREELERVRRESDLAQDEKWKKRQEEMEARFKRKKKQLRKKLREKKEREDRDAAYAAQLLVSQRHVAAAPALLMPDVSALPEGERGLKEMIENLQSKLSENEEMILYQKNTILELEKAKAKNERLAKEAEKKKKKIEREFRRTIRQEIRAKGAKAAQEAAASTGLAVASTEDEAEETESATEGKSDDETDDTDDKTDEPKKEEWDEEDGEDELVEIEDERRLSNSTEHREDGDIDDDDDEDDDDMNDDAEEGLNHNDDKSGDVVEPDASSHHTDGSVAGGAEDSGSDSPSWRRISMKETTASASARLSTSLTRDAHAGKSLTFSHHVPMLPTSGLSASSSAAASPLSHSMLTPLKPHPPPVPPRRRMENWRRGQTEDLKLKRTNRTHSAMESPNEDMAPERWDRPDRRKRAALLKGAKPVKSVMPNSPTSSTPVPTSNLTSALASAFSGRATMSARSTSSETLSASTGAQLQVSLKISCSELSNKTKAVKYDISATVESLLKKKPLANWLKKLQMKRAKESKEQLYYGLYAPVNSGPGDLSPKDPGSKVAPKDVACRGVWLDEESQLWRYDFDEGAAVELRCIEDSKYANDKSNNYVLQILYTIDGAAAEPRTTGRSSQLFKFNKYTTVRDVMTTVGSRLKTCSDVEHYGLLIHKRDGTLWLNPDNILAAYHLQDMDILELKKRFLELCLHEEDKTELRDTTRGLLVPSVAEGRLLLDPSSITVLEATHSVCNWLGIEKRRWEHYGLLASNPPSPDIWLQEGQTLAHYALGTNTIVELQPKTLFSASPRSEPDVADRRSYCLIVKFSPHSSDNVEDAGEGASTTTNGGSGSLIKKMGGMEDVDASLARFCIGGEVLRQHLSGVGLVMPSQLVVGTLCCTNYALMFNPRALASEGMRIPLGSIWRISKVAKNTLLIHSKDFRPNVRFRFASKNLARHWHDILHQNAFPGKALKTFALDFKWEGVNDGWQLFNVQEEYDRQFQLAGKLGKRWRLSDINKRYTRAPTYPEYIGVPVQVLDEVLSPIFEFRSKGRIPALSYLFRNGASITRSSQPMVGFRGNSCPQDEFLLESIYRSNPTADKPNSVLRIYDARPRVNAMANQAMGAGVEKCGPNSRLDFLNIGNIHVMRESYNKLNQLCIFDATSLPSSPTSSSSSSAFSLMSTPTTPPSPLSASWLSNLERTKWLDHLSLILTAATSVALCVYKQTSVLIHCSDGWDRTPQVAALAQLMLDKHYRSIRGFAVLIEKEFLSFGHKFDERYGHAHPDDAGTSQRAPIFPQFLDMVYQLTQQFPCAFEFNERFLVFLLEHLYDCQFGTFLCNSQKEREESRLKEKTVSIWSFIVNNNHKKFDFVNPFYMAEIDVFFPDTGVENLVLWKGFYFRHTMKLGSEDYKLVTRYAKQVTVELRAMQLINTIDTLNEKLKTTTAAATKASQ